MPALDFTEAFTVAQTKIVEPTSQSKCVEQPKQKFEPAPITPNAMSQFSQPQADQKPLLSPHQQEQHEEVRPAKALENNFNTEVLLPPPPQLIGKITVESNHVPNVVVSLPPPVPSQSTTKPEMQEQSKPETETGDRQSKGLLLQQFPSAQVTAAAAENHIKKVAEAQHQQNRADLPSRNLEPLTIDVTSSYKQQHHFEPNKEDESPVIQESNSSSSSMNKEPNNRSLINSIPKPFKSESPPTTETHINSLNKGQTSEAARSCSSLSSSGSNGSLSRRPSLLQQQSLQDEQNSPGSSSLPRPEKRDSKVIKAAQYWNNYIGEVLTKNKPPENPKSLEKPKKIVSAGVGQKGYNDLKNTFEQGGSGGGGGGGGVGGVAMQRRNSKKMSVEACLPGLRVTDALSAFEKKNQPPTPVVYRKNSVAGDSKEKPKWVRPTKVEKEAEFPFVNKPSDELKNKLKSTRQASEKEERPLVMNGSLSHNEEVPKLNGSSHSSANGAKDVTLELRPEKAEKLSKESHDHQKQAAKSLPQQKLMEPIENLQLKHPTSPKPKLKKDEARQKEDNQQIDHHSNNVEVNSFKGRDEHSQLPGQSLTFKSEVKKDVDIPTTKVTTIKVSVEATNKKPAEDETSKITPKSPISKEPDASVAQKDLVLKPGLAKPETIKKVNTGKSGVVVIINNKPRSTPVINNNNLNNKNNNEIASTKLAASKHIDEPKVVQIPLQIQPEAKPAMAEVVHKAEAGRVKDNQPISSQQMPQAVVSSKPVELKIEIATSQKREAEQKPDQKVVKEPSKPVPEEPKAASVSRDTPEPANPLEAAKNALKKIPHAPAMRRKSIEEAENPIEICIKGRTPVADDGFATPTNEPASPLQSDSRSIVSERIIPIQISDSRPSRESSNLTRREHYIPIVVEGRGTILRTPDPYSMPSDDQEDIDRFDTYSTNSLSRRRFGSRKKRMSSALSDTASISTEEDPGESAFAGLQKYTSIGKHGMEESPMFRLRKTRPPFALQREESFSSGEEDIFNDDGFREMTAENLFSTLLTRVKSLTRRIHDEHEDNAALRWQQSRRIINHPLNPGGTHARLERTALRNSIKRTGPPSSAASSTTTAPSLSRQSSYGFPEDQRSSYDDPSPRYRGTRSETESLYSEPMTGDAGSRLVGSSKGFDKYDDSQISVTSKQRLRPGYLPPPYFFPSPLSPPLSDPNATYSSSAVGNRNFDSPTYVTVGSEVERTIPISVQQQRQDLPVSASSSTSSVSTKPSGVYHRPLKPFLPSSSEGQFCDPVEVKERRVSRFLRPDFYDTPKEESIYGRDDEADGGQKTTSRFLKAVRERKSSFDSTEADPRPAQQGERPPTAEGQFLVRDLTDKRTSEVNHPPGPESSTAPSATSSISTFSSSATTTSCTSPPPPPTLNAVNPITVKPILIRPPPPVKAPSPPPASPPPYRNPRSSPPPQSSAKSAAAPAATARSLPWVKSAPNRPYLPPTSPPPSRPDHTRTRRTIHPYGGAKSDGLINQHAFVACHVIAAAERKKRESYSRSSTAELPLEKVNAQTDRERERHTSKPTTKVIPWPNYLTSVVSLSSFFSS